MGEYPNQSSASPTPSTKIKASNVPLRKSQRSRLASSVQSATRQQAVRSASSPPPKLALTPRNRVGDTRNVVPIVIRSVLGRIRMEVTTPQMIRATMQDLFVTLFLHLAATIHFFVKLMEDVKFAENAVRDRKSAEDHAYHSYDEKIDKEIVEKMKQAAVSKQDVECPGHAVNTTELLYVVDCEGIPSSAHSPVQVYLSQTVAGFCSICQSSFSFANVENIDEVDENVPFPLEANADLRDLKVDDDSGVLEMLRSEYVAASRYEKDQMMANSQKMSKIDDIVTETADKLAWLAEPFPKEDKTISSRVDYMENKNCEQSSEPVEDDEPVEMTITKVMPVVAQKMRQTTDDVDSAASALATEKMGLDDSDAGEDRHSTDRRHSRRARQGRLAPIRTGNFIFHYYTDESDEDD